MKTKTTILLLLLLLNVTLSKGQSWQWVKCIGSTYDEEQVNDMKVDAQGNVYVCGQIKGNAMISGTGQFVPNWWDSNSPLSLSGFVAKFNCDGDLVWIKAAGAGYDYQNKSTCLLLDDYGHLYVLGEAQCITSRPLHFYDSTYSNVIISDMYITKFDTSGNCLWAKIGSVDYTPCYSFAVAACFSTSGAINAIANINMDGVLFGDTVKRSISLIQFDTSGVVTRIDSIQAGGYYNFGHTLLSDSNDNLYVCGSWTLDSIIVGNQTYYNPKKFGNNSQVFHVTKFDSLGQFQWIYMFTDTTTANPWGASGTYGRMSIDSSGLYIAGVTVNGIKCGNHVFTTPFGPFQDVVFLLKLDFQGNPVWVIQGVNQYNGSEESGTTALAPNHDIYFSMDFAGMMIMGNDTLYGMNNYNDMPLCRVSPSGQLLGCTSLSTAGIHDAALIMQTDASGNVYMAGLLEGTVSVPGITVNYYGGDNDAFVAKWGNSCTVGIAETTQQEANRLQCYPNPFSEYLTIFNRDYIKIELYNSMGEKVMEQPGGTGNLIRLHTVQLPSGIYIIKATGKQGVYALKAVKQEER